MIEIVRVNRRKPSPKDIRRAVEELKKNRLVIFPTETLYGIGGNALSKNAIRALIKAKKRTPGKGFIVLINAKKSVKLFTKEISKDAKRLMDTFWPGPLTLIFKKRPSVPKLLTGGASTIALRYTSHKVPQALIKGLGSPITAPSANKSGNTPPEIARAAIADFSDTLEVRLAFDSGRSKDKKPSTIVDVSQKKIHILRVGAISTSQVLKALKGN